MSASDVARSQRILDKMGAKLGLTDPGKEWLIAAVDPYHDTPVNCCGYPDVNEAASVLQVVKLSTTLSAPSGVTTNWDCHIHQFPWMDGAAGLGGNFATTTSGNQITGYGSFLLGSSTTTPTNINNSSTSWFGLAVDSVASGLNTFQYQDLGSHDVPFRNTLAPYLVGEYRVVGMGFEVVNTTAELNLQGLCTVYRQPCNSIDSAKSALVTSGSIVGGGGATQTLSFGYLDLLQTNTPPATPGEALLLDNSRQWKAKEGCYVVSTLNSSELPAGINNTSPVMHLSSLDAQTGAGWVLVQPRTQVPSLFSGVSFVAGSTTFTIDTYPTGSCQMQPFNHSGAIFSGLSNSTTLQLNAIYYIERFPSQQDSSLVVLAKQSCHADRVAIDLYSEIIKEMPVGVPQRMNGMGEWFADAVSSAADFISPVLSAIPVPMIQSIGSGVKMAGGIAKSLGSKPKVEAKKEVGPGATFSPNGAVSTALKKAKEVHANKKKKK